MPLIDDHVIWQEVPFLEPENSKLLPVILLSNHAS